MGFFVTSGDPAGIGPEIVLKTLLSAELSEYLHEHLEAGKKLTVTLASSYGLFMEQARHFGLETAFEKQFHLVVKPNSGEDSFICLSSQYINLNFIIPKDEDFERLVDLGIPQAKVLKSQALNLLKCENTLDFAVIDSRAALLAAASLVCAYRLASNEQKAFHNSVSEEKPVLLTPPIHKEAFKALGVPFPGHTEFLGALAGVASPLTMFDTLGLRIFFHSRHVSLRKACDLLQPEAVLESLRDSYKALQRLGIQEPHLALAALNPHGGEHGLFGDEEGRFLLPAIEAARSEGIQVSGPIPADSVFHMAKTGKFSAVLSLYHDQGHIAAKTLDFDRTISMTLGMDILRVSVDHGTAFDIAGKGIAREISMIQSFKTAFPFIKA